MTEIRLPVLRRATRVCVLLAIGALAGCGDDPITPVLTEPGFVLSVSIPGLTDTTIQGDSTYWQILSGLNAEGEPERDPT